VLELPPPAAVEGSALITGGTGGLGALVARHLVLERGVRKVVLASRRGREAVGAPELEAQLRAAGADVLIAACDVSDREQLRALIASLGEEHPLKMVVHAAGVLEDGVIESLTTEQVDRVLAPKIDAAWNLHELTSHLDLQAFVLFSSAAGALGSPGQGNYAAGNAFLDALAAYRQVRGLPARSVAWGYWAEGTGMTSHLGESDLARMARLGVEALSNEEGLELFDASCAIARTMVLPLRLDLKTLGASARAGQLPPLLSGLVRAPTRRAGVDRSLAVRLAGVPEGDRERLVLDVVRSEVAMVLGHTELDVVDADRAFKDLGFDSLLTIELRNRLQTTTGLSIPMTQIFNYPTPLALAAHLGERLAEAMPKASPAVDAELDRLERVLAGRSLDAREQSLVQERLHLLLRGLDGAAGANGGAEEVGATVADTIRSASADEVIDFIDSQLGSAGAQLSKSDPVA
jgi:NAD(P)-dependent dehydrogenase (short-subunit alcohol dehydrogenase family)/acyl carrier protein